MAYEEADLTREAKDLLWDNLSEAQRSTWVLVAFGARAANQLQNFLTELSESIEAQVEEERY